MKFLRRHWKKVLSIFLLVVFACGGAYAYTLYAKADAVVKTVTKSGSVVDLLKPEALNGESSGVVNILIAGNSVDDADHPGAALTDSIMVASYNLADKKLTLISIPRDLYVDVNGSYMKINAAYTNGGMDTLKSVVQTVTGLTINHQVLINYAAFKNLIDAVGGIDVTIAASDERGIYDPMIGFSITNGTHHLTGEEALLLVRCRNDPTYDGRIAYGLPNGDFDRAANQRMVLLALLSKVNSGQALTNVSTLQSLIDSFSGNVTTDFTAGQLRRVYDLSKQSLTTNSISIRGDGTTNYLSDYYTVAAGSALIPRAGIGNYTAIQAYITDTITPVQTTAEST
jgi:LCP family protein required for cell wall assembly